MKGHTQQDGRKNIGIQNGPDYQDRHIILTDQAGRLEHTLPLMAKAYTVLLCRQGEGELYLNGNLHRIKAHDIAINLPNTCLKCDTLSHDFRFFAIMLSPKYFSKLRAFTHNNPWNLKLLLDKSPVLSLEEYETEVLCKYYDLLKFRLNSGMRLSFKKEILGSLLLTFLYELHNILERFTNIRPYTYTSNENIFLKFNDLLINTYPKPRQVQEYARKLCITPQYLSAICKAACGKTASDLINQYVVKDIQYLLRQPDKSIKSIAYELDFPNLSFFGKFVKKHTGMSPRKYREAQLQHPDA